jgi:isopentenyl diphosphate isomerase/L-lactate dehydrogenase-like FMN-dependent dehydrogenase
MIMNKDVGEKGPARVAATHQLPYILSTLTNTHPKTITSVNPTGVKLMQLYLCQDWGINHRVVRMAEESGFDGLVVTVDAQVLGTRRKELRYPLDSSQYKFPVLEEVLGP